MLVTIKNGLRTLKLNATELRQLMAVKMLLLEVAKDFAGDNSDLKTKLETAATLMAQVDYMGSTPRTAEKPAAITK